MLETSFRDAIRQALLEEMRSDENSIIIGEDIGAWGGAFKVTEGFLAEFGADRVVDAPIAESAIVGAGIGCALMGMKAIVEIQFMDFIDCAFSIITNFAAKSYYRTGDNVPIVVRGPSGGGVNGGPFHSQNTEGWFTHVPGLKVVVPATVYDAKGLLKAAVRDPDPVLFFEHKNLYHRLTEKIPQEEYTVPLGQGIVRRQGKDLTVITYGQLVHEAVAAAEEIWAQGLEIEVLDLRTLLPYDKKMILESVRKTGRVILMCEDTTTGAVTAEISSFIAEEAFSSLKAPVCRLDHADRPVPYAPALEMSLRPSKAKLVEKIKKLAAY